MQLINSFFRSLSTLRDRRIDSAAYDSVRSSFHPAGGGVDGSR